jgi:hypothetical protein
MLQVNCFSIEKDSEAIPEKLEDVIREELKYQIIKIDLEMR